MFVNHLGDCVAQKHNILVKRFDLTLQLDAVDQVNGHRHVFAPELVQKWVLQELAFVIAHDMFRVQRVEEARPYHTLDVRVSDKGLILILVRIGRGLHFNPQRCAHQVESLAKTPFQVAFVRI